MKENDENGGDDNSNSEKNKINNLAAAAAAQMNRSLAACVGLYKKKYKKYQVVSAALCVGV